jgi:type I restriction enzyme S subunit
MRVLLSLRVPAPPLPEQRRIVDILNRANGIRRLRREAQEKAQNVVPALFVDMFGDAITNPKGWPVSSLGELLDFVTSGSRGWAKYHATQGARFIRVQDLRGHRLRLDGSVFVDPPDAAEAKRTLIQPADLLLAITGASIGLTGVAPQSIGRAHVSQHVAILRLRPNQADPTFVHQYLSNGRGGQRQIASLQYGQTKPGLGLEQIRRLQIISPPIQLQRAFADSVADLQSIISQQERAAAAAGRLVNSLMAQVFAP